MRVWIETRSFFGVSPDTMVTLRVRVWIETQKFVKNLKGTLVTLRVRVWIETKELDRRAEFDRGHPPREGVD